MNRCQKFMFILQSFSSPSPETDKVSVYSISHTYLTALKLDMYSKLPLNIKICLSLIPE